MQFRKSTKNLFLVLLTMTLFACANNDEKEKSGFDSSLYSGKPIDSLTNDDPPKSEIEAIQRGDIALNQSNLDLALYEYVRSLEFKDAVNQSKTLYTIGRIHLVKENVDIAEVAFRKSLDFDAGNVNSLEQLGILYGKKGLNKDSAYFFFNAINADQVRLGSSEIITEYRNVTEEQILSLKIDSESPYLSYMGLGILSDVENKNDIAKRLYEKSLEIKPDNVSTLINLGFSHYMSKNYYLALRITNRALKYEPENEKASNNSALIYLAMGEYQKSLSIFKRHMTEPEALNNIGYFLIINGKPEQAIPYLQQAIDKNPSYYKVANDNLQRALDLIRVKSKV
ncbi:hypothetical protein AB4113_00835 [Vibrio breoganii]